MHYWIGLGSNLGIRLETLRHAADALSAHGTIIARSRVFAASPVGGPPQPPFLNAALLVDCALTPMELLRAVNQIEATLGRDREHEVRWGPRTIDIDLLLAGTKGEIVVRDAHLAIPHASLHERGFALAPVLDLDASLVHPTLMRPLSALLIEVAAGKNLVAPTGERL